MRPLYVALLGTLLALGLTSLSRAAEAPSFVMRPDDWFASEQGKTVVANILSWQRPTGGWPKAYDALTKNTTAAPHIAPHGSTPAAQAAIKEEGESSWDIATIDNNATHSELRILARAVTLTKDDEAKAGFYKGLDAVLRAQYPNGGFPQRFPAPKNYGSHITFNDGAMIRLMQVLKDISENRANYEFIDATHRAQCQAAFDKGIECMLNCQVIIDGKLTCWCAQHDEVTLKPAGARKYELPSLSGAEGSEIAIFLMRLDHPSDRVKKSIEEAAAWFDSVKVVGKAVVPGRTPEGLRDRVVVDDPASTIWARFYDLDTGKPMFSGRDGIEKTALADIEQERRAGYAWYGMWGRNVATQYAAWKKRMEPQAQGETQPAASPPAASKQPG